MDVAFVLLGLVMSVGSFFMYQEFTERRSLEKWGARFGFSFMAIGGLGAILVGAFPENTISYMHVTGAGLAIGGGNLGILLLGLTLPLPEGLRGFMLFFSSVSLAAVVCFAFHRYFGLGPGGMERIAAYPETVWLIRFGIYMSRNHYSHGRTPACVDGVRYSPTG